MYDRNRHYKPFCDSGIPVDVISSKHDFSKYKMVIAPVLAVTTPRIAKKIEEYVQNGGVFVTTYWAGVMDGNFKYHIRKNGKPGLLKDVLGLYIEETDSLPDWKKNVSFMPLQNNSLGLTKEYPVSELCERIHLKTGKALANYKGGIYDNTPLLTENKYGKGSAYLIGARLPDETFLKDFYNSLINKLNIRRIINVNPPYGVIVQERSIDDIDYVFMMNFTEEEKVINLTEKSYDIINNCDIKTVKLKSHGYSVIRRKHKK
jgi:beta-galactosidase